MIEAVVDVVAQHGISGTTFANVSATAGVSQGALVFHFKTKEGLLTETLSRLLHEYEQAWSAAFASPDPLDRILGLIRADFKPSDLQPQEAGPVVFVLGRGRRAAALQQDLRGRRGCPSPGDAGQLPGTGGDQRRPRSGAADQFDRCLQQTAYGCRCTFRASRSPVPRRSTRRWRICGCCCRITPA